MPGGRPTKYKPEYAMVAKAMCELGAIDLQIAEFLKVDGATVQRWKLQYPEFCESIKTGKGPADDKVEMALYHRALGYSHQDVDIRVIDGEVIQTPIIKHYPPDTGACIFWLKNRRPEKWREKQEVMIEGTAEPIEFVLAMKLEDDACN